MKKEIQKQLENLDKNELGIIIFNLLKTGKIDFIQLSSLYVQYLETLKKDKRVNIFGLASVLSMFRDYKPKEIKKQEMFMKQKSAYHIIKSNIFRETKYENELKDFLKENPYLEDEFGVREL